MKIYYLLCLCLFVSFSFAKNVNVGGNIKFYMYDMIDGESTYLENGQTVEQDEQNDSSFGASRGIIFINSTHADNFSANLDVEFVVHAGATPKIGDPIERNADAEIEEDFFNLNFTYVFENEIEVKAGLFLPKFTWDYGYHKFWNEQYNGFFATISPFVGSWHDSGLEFYKNFDFDSFSLPIYLYLLNGDGNDLVDSNNQKTLMFHSTPEFLMGQLSFLTSFAIGKWDDDSKKDYMKYALGIKVETENFWIRSEYIYSKYDDRFIVFERSFKDVSSKGFYLKANYNFLKKCNIILGYSELKKDFSNFFATLSSNDEKYKSILLSFKYQLNELCTLLFNIDNLNGERDVTLEEVDYTRYTLGSNITF